MAAKHGFARPHLGKGFPQVSSTTFVGGEGGQSGVSLDAPVLTWVSDVDDSTPEFSAALTLPEEDDIVQLQIATDVNFSSIVFDEENTLDAGEVADEEALFTGDALADGQHWARARHKRGAAVSAWSNVETKTIAAEVLMSKGVSVIGNGVAGAVETVSGAGSNYVVEDNSGDLYWVYIDASLDVVFVKSTDQGETWAAPVTVFTGSATNLSIWFDRWSGIAAGKIHCVYTDAGADDTLYRSIDTESADALGTQTVVFAGSTTAAGGALSITRARGGNLYCKTTIDAGAEGGFFRSTDAGANWTSRTDSEALATQDQWILMPGWAADNQDIMMFFWDASADEISRVLYDDSADTWAETSIATSMVDVPAATTPQYPHFAAAVDIANSQNLLVAWNAADLANADLLAWKVTESAITALTDVITNSTDDQGFAALGIDTDTGDLYVYYGGAADGAENFAASTSLRYSVSTDDGATWGAANVVLHRQNIHGLWMTPRFTTDKVVVMQSLGPYMTAIYERS